MNIDIALSVAKALTGSIGTVDLVSSAVGELLKKFTQARERYELERPDPKTPIEVSRQQLLSKVSKLQYEIVLSLSDSTVLAKTLPVLLDLASQTYEASTEQELNLVEISIGQVQAALDNYHRGVAQRAKARRWAVFATVLALLGFGFLVYWGSLEGGPRSDTLLPVVQIPLPVLVWSAIGSFVSMLYRFNTASESELKEPVRWLLTRPVVGVAMGTVSYFIVKLGLLSIDSTASASAGTLELVWLIAFLTGFSDRFAETLLRTLVGSFGGKTDEPLLTFRDEKATGSAFTEPISAVASWSRRQAERIRTAPPTSPEVENVEQDFEVSEDSKVEPIAAGKVNKETSIPKTDPVLKTQEASVSSKVTTPEKEKKPNDNEAPST